MNRPQPRQQAQQMGGSLPYRRPPSVTGQPIVTENQVNGGPYDNQSPGMSCETHQSGEAPTGCDQTVTGELGLQYFGNQTENIFQNKAIYFCIKKLNK